MTAPRLFPQGQHEARLLQIRRKVDNPLSASNPPQRTIMSRPEPEVRTSIPHKSMTGKHRLVMARKAHFVHQEAGARFVPSINALWTVSDVSLFSRLSVVSLLFGRVRCLCPVAVTKSLIWPIFT